MAGTYLPLAAAVTLLVATSAVPAAAAVDKYSGRMVIVRASGATVVSADGALSKWQQRRLVEDEVAPEFGGGQLLGAGNGDIFNNKGLDKNRPVCPKEKNCGADGEPYSGRPCSPYYLCPK